MSKRRSLRIARCRVRLRERGHVIRIGARRVRVRGYRYAMARDCERVASAIIREREGAINGR